MMNNSRQTTLYFSFAAKRMIIRQGHKADNFYLILSGTGRLYQ